MSNFVTPAPLSPTLFTAQFAGVPAGQTINVPGLLATDVIVCCTQIGAGGTVPYFSISGANTISQNFTSLTGILYEALIWRPS